MTPIDHRNATFKAILGLLTGRRVAVYETLLRAGPCTTRELAERSALDLLTVRPRITELVQLGLVECAEEHRGHEGIYQALPLDVAEQRFEAAQTEQQGELAL